MEETSFGTYCLKAFDVFSSSVFLMIIPKKKRKKVEKQNNQQLSLPAFSLFTISKACFPLQENEAYTSIRLLDGEKRTCCAAIKEYVHLEGKWEGATLLPCQMNLTDPCRTIRASTTFEGCQPGGLGHLFQYMREYNAESPKQDSKRFNSIVKMIGFGHLVIIYLWQQCTVHLYNGHMYI